MTAELVRSLPRRVRHELFMLRHSNLFSVVIFSRLSYKCARPLASSEPENNTGPGGPLPERLLPFPRASHLEILFWSL